MSYWAVVQCESQREHMARLLLMRAGFETYMPRVKIRNRIALLFPTYLFVRIVGQWYVVLWTPHVVRVLMSGDKPAQIKGEILAHIRKREHGGFVRLPLPNRNIKPGQRVMVTNGAFQGQIGLYQGQTGRDRERVLLELLGQSVPVDIPSPSIVPLPIAFRPNVRY